MRLADVERAHGPRLEVHCRAFPLVPDVRPGRRATAQTQASRARAAADEPRAPFVTPVEGTVLPASSVPALIAAKAAERQGRAAVAALHDRLFAAHFRDQLDISRGEVLRLLATEAGMDVVRCERDCESEELYQAVLRDCAEAVAWFGMSALPAVIVNEKVSLVGAVPAEQYRLLIDWMLAGEPGGVIPLDHAEPTAAPGRTAVGQSGASSATAAP